MTFEAIRNAKCLDGFPRCKWAKLGRTGASQASVAIDEKGRLFSWGQNYWGQSGQGDPCYLNPGSITRREFINIEYATQLTHFSDFVKSCSGEVASMALRENGELWGWGNAEGNDDGVDGQSCASFGLPHDSGVCHTCCRGVPQAAGYYYLFYNPVLCTPGYLWKDFAFDYYHGIGIGLDNKLYTWGANWDWALGMDEDVVAVDKSTPTPILNTYLTDDIKFVDATIVSLSCSYWAIIVLLSNGELWGVGAEYIYGDQGVTGNSTTFKQITCFANPIVMAKTTALGSSALWIIDDQGNIWGWSDGIDEFVGNDPNPSPDWELPNLIASEYEGQNVFIDAVLNTHNGAFQAIDNRGYLWTWGSQGWGPHLAIGAARSQSEADDDPNITDVVILRSLAGYAEPPLNLQGEFLSHNTLPTGDSEYVQPLPQMLRHKPCGHWHLRLFEEEAIWPRNCWMPSVSIYQNHLMFVACGKHLQTGIDTGCEVMIFDYDIDANIWTLALYHMTLWYLPTGKLMLLEQVGMMRIIQTLGLGFGSWTKVMTTI